MDTNTIRKTFIEYFKEHDHKEAPSSSLVPDEPTLLLTNSGMVQMMPYLLMQQNPPHIRMCSVQKSFRTVDIDDIGIDGRHLTFFEMLGSWSFGDYYKKDAIHLAYDLLVNKFHFDKEKIWPSVFSGEGPIPKDEDSIKYWLAEGIPMDRITLLGWKDNFWGPPGETGPCGPSTEVYYDMGEELSCGKDTCAPGCDCDRFLEIWNAGVFMEYYKDEFGNFSPLPQKNVDTGAGLERMAAFLQGKKDAYDTDLLRQIVDAICKKLVITDYDTNEKTKRSVKIITDHTRASVFLITDGVMPSNEHRGYILRKLLRRAMAQVRINKGNAPFFDDLIDLVVKLYKDQYPNLEIQKEHVKEVMRLEEDKFSKTLQNGIKQLKKLSQSKKLIEGADLFKLQDTYGIPPEISVDLMDGLGISYDKEDWNNTFKENMQAQRQRSRIGSTFTLGKVIEGEFKDYPATTFTGYTNLRDKAKLLGIKTTEDAYLIVLDTTPMYAESGGQSGDKGTISFSPDDVVSISNVKKTKRGVYVHIAPRLGENEFVLSYALKKDHEVNVEVDELNRKRSSYNHTATHLLHWALQQVLGKDALQRGSYLDANKLRFDFKYDQMPSKEQIEHIEKLVNEKIQKNEDVHIHEMSLQEAKKEGAIGLFENKYGDEVRTVKIGNFSFELCGGTHATNTSELGTFRIIKVESISEGVKRIRAVLE